MRARRFQELLRAGGVDAYWRLWSECLENGIADAKGLEGPTRRQHTGRGEPRIELVDPPWCREVEVQPDRCDRDPEKEPVQ
eukprot:4920230-Alexandrium_andersonii.AAC.1